MDETTKLAKALTEMATSVASTIGKGKMEINRLQKQIEDLKNCGNCGACPHDSFEYCEDWEQDKLKRKDRERRK